MIHIDPAVRHPVDPRAAFIVFLALMAGIVLVAFGKEPRSIEENLPPIAVLVWSLSLIFGALFTLVGMFFRSISGVLLEQLGVAWLSIASFFYFAAILVELGWGGFLASYAVLGWAIVSAIRFFQLQALVNKAKRVQSWLNERDVS